MPTNRREFLTYGSILLPACSLSGLIGCAGSPEARGRLFEISLAQWSLNRSLRGGELSNMEFPRAATELGFDAVEYVNTNFREESRDPASDADLRKATDDLGVRNVLIMCDNEGNLGDPADAGRAAAVENHYRWLDVGKTLGCHSIRVNARSSGSPEEQMRLAADGLRRLTERADTLDLNVLVENHGGLSSSGAWLGDVMRLVDHPRCGTLPDFGNFNIGRGETYDRYQGVAELMPFAKGVSAKSYDFDEAGDETTIDYRRMMRIVMESGYRGHVGVEYEGQVLAERDGIIATRALLERIHSELAAS
jgi:sugar phosphate isomerase/epimerase